MTAHDFLHTDLYEHLARLSPDTQALWGRMSAQQMIEHLILIPSMCNGTIEGMVAAGTPEQQAKRKWHTLVNRTPIPRELRQPFLPEEPMPCRFGDITEAIEALKEATMKFYAYFKENPTAELVHPVFGVLTFDEWATFQMIHASHHLQQFGLISEEAQQD